LRAWVLTRFEDVAAVFEDEGFEAVNPGEVFAELARKGNRDYRNIIRFLHNTLFFETGEQHKRNRRTAAAIINRVALSRLEPRIADLADRFRVSLSARDDFDAVTDFADPFPQLVMGQILGLREDDATSLGQLIGDTTLVFDPLDLRTCDRIERSLAEAISLVSARLVESVDGDAQSPLALIYNQAGASDRLADAGAFTLFLYRVGSETTMGLLGFAFRALLDDPALASCLREEPSLISNFVAEALRLESNVQRAFRVSRADKIIGGQLIRAGQRVMLLIGAANRDPALFCNTDEYSLKSRGPDLAFGAGAHTCLGASLARLEGRIAVERFLTLSVERAGEDHWYGGRSIRRLTGLRVRATDAPRPAARDGR
jgi:cytochrome P450